RRYVDYRTTQFLGVTVTPKPYARTRDLVNNRRTPVRNRRCKRESHSCDRILDGGGRGRRSQKSRLSLAHCCDRYQVVRNAGLRDQQPRTDGDAFVLGIQLEHVGCRRIRIASERTARPDEVAGSCWRFHGLHVLRGGVVTKNAERTVE